VSTSGAKASEEEIKKIYDLFTEQRERQDQEYHDLKTLFLMFNKEKEKENQKTVQLSDAIDKLKMNQATETETTAQLSDEIDILKYDRNYEGAVIGLLGDKIDDLKGYQTTQFNDMGKLIATRTDMLQYIHLMPYFVNMMGDEDFPIELFLKQCLKENKKKEFNALIAKFKLLDAKESPDEEAANLLESNFIDFCKSVTIDDLNLTVPSTYKAVISKFDAKIQDLKDTYKEMSASSGPEEGSGSSGV